MGRYGLSSRAIIGKFYAKLEELSLKSWVNRLSNYFESNQESETYKWLGMVPALREWVGGRVAKGLSENSYVIKNKKFEATLEIMVDDIRRDKTGQIDVRINELAVRVIQHWAKLLSAIINAGYSTACYDGQYFFDTDHSEGKSGTQDNDLTCDISALAVNQHGSVSAPSPEEVEQVILKGIQAILGFKDDQGEPLNDGAKEFVAMAPVGYMAPVIAACKNPVLTSGKTNTLTQSSYLIEPVVNARLTAADKVLVFRADGEVKPLIRQEEETLKVSVLGEGSEEEFKNDRHLYGVKALRNVGYGLWSQAVSIQLV